MTETCTAAYSSGLYTSGQLLLSTIERSGAGCQPGMRVTGIQDAPGGSYRAAAAVCRGSSMVDQANNGMMSHYCRSTHAAFVLELDVVKTQ